LDAVLLRLVFQISIYVLWKEKNSRRHGGKMDFSRRTTKIIGKRVKIEFPPKNTWEITSWSLCLGDGLM
ncbi:unnamed protein product, partial [Brassica oleracea var. botrytis]